MSQWYAIVYRTGPQAGEVKSYGTVITGDDPDGPSFDSANYEKIAIDHQPRSEETWDKVSKAVVVDPVKVQERVNRIADGVRRKDLKEIKRNRKWTEDEFQDAIALSL